MSERTERRMRAHLQAAEDRGGHGGPASPGGETLAKTHQRVHSERRWSHRHT